VCYSEEQSFQVPSDLKFYVSLIFSYLKESHKRSCSFLPRDKSDAALLASLLSIHKYVSFAFKQTSNWNNMTAAASATITATLCAPQIQHRKSSANFQLGSQWAFMFHELRPIDVCAVGKERICRVSVRSALAGCFPVPRTFRDKRGLAAPQRMINC